MEQAKSAVKDFLNKSGHHDTTVHEKVAPAVTHETRHTHQHENVTTAIDKEVHQDHYHTSVQPVHHEETLPEKHHHNIIPVEHKEHHHGNDESIKQKIQMEAAKFKDEKHRGEHKETSTVVPTVTGEHMHHHVHEVIQPVVHKQTVEPHVVHTTIPVHEVHHNDAHHHATSSLPAVSLADFKKQGGVLSGREERNDGFEGEPRSIMSGSGTGHHAGEGAALAEGATHGHHHNGGGLTGNNSLNQPTNEFGTSTHGHGANRDITNSGGAVGSTDPNYSSTNSKAPIGTAVTDDTTRKPGLMSKINPMTDSNGDGQKGFMK